MEMLSVQSDKIEKKIGGMATKEDLGKMQKGLVSKVDLQNMEAAISKNTKIHIAEAVDPIKSEICDLRQRVKTIEDTSGSNPVQSSKTTAEISKLKQMVNKVDPAKKRAALIGFPDTFGVHETRGCS